MSTGEPTLHSSQSDRFGQFDVSLPVLAASRRRKFQLPNDISFVGVLGQDIIGHVGLIMCEAPITSTGHKGGTRWNGTKWIEVILYSIHLERRLM